MNLNIFKFYLNRDNMVYICIYITNISIFRWTRICKKNTISTNHMIKERKKATNSDSLSVFDNT